MKNNVFTLGILAAGALLFSGCVKGLPTEQEPQTVTLTFTADKVVTKTAVTEDEATKKATYTWTDEDVANMKLYTVTVDDEGKESLNLLTDVTTNIVSDTEIAVTATVEANKSYTFRAALSNELTNGKAPRMKAEQNPNGIESFDPNADLLVSDDIPLEVTDEGVGTLPLYFRRYVSVNKMTLSNMVAGEKVQKVTLISNKHLTGYLKGKEVAGQKTEITLTYDDVEVPADGKFPVYFTAMENAGHSLTIKVNTDQYTYEKTFAEGQTIDFQVGKYTRFGVALPEGTAKTSISLPVEDSMEWAIASDGKDATAALTLSGIGVKKDGKDVYSAVSTAYKGSVGLKLGSGSNRGSITTSDLDLSSAYYIKVDAQAWLNSSGVADDSRVVFIVDGETIFTSPNLTSAFKTYYFNASAATDASKVEIKVTGKRGYIKNLVIASGEYELPLAPEELSVTDQTTEFEVGDDFVFDGEVTLIWNNGDEDVLDEADFTVDASAVDMTTAGTYTVTVTYNDDPTIKATYTITVTDPNGNDGSAEHPFTASEAITFVNGLSSTPTEDEYYVSGIVTRVLTQYGSNNYGDATFFISDDGTTDNEFEAYQILYLNNTAWAEGDDYVGIGDEVVVCARLTKYNNQVETYTNTRVTPVVKGYLVSITKSATPPAPASLTITGAQQSFNVGDSFTFGGTVTLVYDNLTTEELSANDYSVDSSAVDMTTAGSYTVTVTFNSNTNVKGTYTISVVSSAGTAIPYENTLINGHTDFEIENVSLGGLSYVWNDSKYGITANGYGCTSDVEAYLVSPTFNLTAVTSATLSFQHNIRYFASVDKAKEQAVLQIKVGNGSWTNLTINDWSSNGDNNFTDATSVSLNAYCGNTVQLRFKFLAVSGSNPGRWEIKNFNITGE